MQLGEMIEMDELFYLSAGIKSTYFTIWLSTL